MPCGLYIHVPFCVKKCSYCDFYSAPPDSGETLWRYTSAVIANIAPLTVSFDTVYFGGGTPSLLPAKAVYDILCAADIKDSAEISLECNPESVTAEKLADYRAAGVNRLSFGIQSLCDRELSAVGRLHNAADAAAAVKAAYKSGFDNISADLMLGLPYQTTETLNETLNGFFSLPLTHISAYMLKIEAGTLLSRSKTLCAAAADDDTLALFYEQTAERLEKAGFKRYEISNFAKNGYECRHNLKYWRCEDYIGIGPSAHSCFGGKRYAVSENTEIFLSSIPQRISVTDKDPCTPEERLMLGLRLAEGIDTAAFGEYGCRIKSLSKPLIQHGFLKESGTHISLTLKGCLVSNEIICRLL